MKKQTSWRAKLDNGREPKVVQLQKPFCGVPAGSAMLVSTPREVESYIRNVPYGSTVDPKQLRRDLAEEHHAETTCPASTGIFLRIVAEAALEEVSEGKPLEGVTPFWRVVDEKSPTARKLSCGPELLRRLRRHEAQQHHGSEPAAPLRRSAAHAR